MNTRCKIVCPLACQNCDITPCEDRLADEVYEGKGFDNRTESVKEAEALKHCGMADAIMCRHCHEDNCRVRKAARTF